MKSSLPSTPALSAEGQGKKSFKPVNEVADAKKARKDRQAFYTPLALVDKLVEWGDPFSSIRVLEPSAGDGRIVHALQAAGVESVDACEIDSDMRTRLAEMGANLVADDFLKYRPVEPYQLIVMNPPFNGKTVDKHIEHAWTMLAPGGRLLSIAPPSVGQRMDEMRLKLPGCNSATYEHLGAESFAEYGTNIAVIVVELLRDPSGEPRKVEGFSNHATYNAAISISSYEKAYEDRKNVSAENLAAAWSRELSRGSSSIYGINWPEVADYLSEVWADPKPDVSYGPVAIESRWESIFGEKGDVFTESERRQRWGTWLRLARRSPESRDQAKWWHDHGECGGCIHKRGGWCNLAGLPVTINPILTFRQNLIGFACMGAGFDDGTPKAGPVPGVAPGEQGVLWRESRGLS